MDGYRKTTLADVASEVGVSAITVSRALRTPEKVSEGLRQRIAVAIEKLGYHPDTAARALASKRTNVIGVIIPSITNNVFTDLLHGIYEGVDGGPFDIQLGNYRYSPLKEEQLLRIFLGQKPAGLVIAGFDQTDNARALLERAPCPVVQVMELGENPADMLVGFSPTEAAAAATRHLVARGYRAPAFLGARMDPRSQRRFKGFRAAASEAGLFDDRRVLTTSRASTVALGGQMLAEMLERAPETDAVFCNNDDLALGVLFEAQRRRIDVPDQLGICGFNDFEMMAAAAPSITSVRTFREEMGHRAIAMLSDAINGNRPAEPVIDLGFEVRERESTARG
jgi:LacI family gluconate utilization system Gnt-I transcriptional repressor